VSQEFKPYNQDTDDLYNREPGIVISPGSNAAKEYSKFEQFPSKWTAGYPPGNPYVYRPYPKMLYRAQDYHGKVCCMAARPDEGEFRDPREYERAVDSAERFTQRCQMIVNDERERSIAMEQGWRESPDDAVAFVKSRNEGIARAAAERNYEVERMSEKARAEMRAAEQANDGRHLEVMPEAKRRRGRPRKVDSPSHIKE